MEGMRAGQSVIQKVEFAEGFIITSDEPEFRGYAMWEWCSHCHERRARARYKDVYSCLKCWNSLPVLQPSIMKFCHQARSWEVKRG